MSELFTNSAKQRLKSGEQLSACWLQLVSPIAAEIVAQAGYDMVVIDGEHAPVEPANLYPLLQAVKGYPCMPMVRAPWNDFVAIKRLLDCGAMGVHIPYVNTKEEAEEAVRACKYPPRGVRGIAGSPRACGFGLNRGQYLQRANDQILTMVAIETLEGADHVAEMCEIEDLDGIFIGPMDLSTNMGHFASPAHPDVQAKIREIEQTVLAHHKLLGSVAGNAQAAKAMYERGYSYVIFSSDSGDLAKYEKNAVEEFHAYMDKKNEP